MSISIKRGTLFALSALLLGVCATSSSAQQQARVAEVLRPAYPQMALSPRAAAGRAAVDRLGGNLATVAAWYGKTPEALRTELLGDQRLRVDRSGRLFAVDELEVPLAVNLGRAGQFGVQDGELYPLDQTFLLHSKPGSTKTIYLNFRGLTIAGTAWNDAGTPITAAPFDIDGNGAALSAGELQRIQYIWQRVAEDYAPFDVDVTTEPPASDRITRSGNSDAIYGTTVVITRKTGVYSCSCGGVAYLGVFNATSDYYKPALVFFDALGNGDEKYVAEAISHEAGHNMGLSHDGTATLGYYTGQGNDAATGWAPIMGVGYYKPLVQFSKGEYPGANNKQDDYGVAQSFGLPLRTDDYGSTIAAPSAFGATITGGAASGSVSGVIEGAGDRDIFAIPAGPGSFIATVAPAARSPNADIVLSLLDGTGSVLASSNPMNALGGTLSYTIPAQGTWFLEVKGTGQGDPAGTGYSNFGSTGLYKLSASYSTTGNAPPVAVLTATPASGTAPLAVTLDGRGSSDDGAVAFYDWDFGNGTTDSSGTLTNIQRTYTTAGTYTVRLTVTDNQGLRASTTKTITVNAPVLQKTTSIQGMQLALKLGSSGTASASGSLTVVNQLGQPMPGAMVSATWSGAARQTFNLKTASNGRLSFMSPSSKSKDCFKLTVTRVTATGYSFNSAPLPTSQVCR